MNTYKNLIVWQKSVEFVVALYEITKSFPGDELYGLVSQMRRAGVSISSNIAEGKMRGYDKEFKRFLLVAFGSGGELATQIEIASRLGYIKPPQAAEIEFRLNEIMKMLYVLISN